MKEDDLILVLTVEYFLFEWWISCKNRKLFLHVMEVVLTVSKCKVITYHYTRTIYAENDHNQYKDLCIVDTAEASRTWMKAPPRNSCLPNILETTSNVLNNCNRYVKAYEICMRMDRKNYMERERLTANVLISIYFRLADDFRRFEHTYFQWRLQVSIFSAAYLAHTHIHRERDRLT